MAISGKNAFRLETAGFLAEYCTQQAYRFASQGVKINDDSTVTEDYTPVIAEKCQIVRGMFTLWATQYKLDQRDRYIQRFTFRMRNTIMEVPIAILDMLGVHTSHPQVHVSPMFRMMQQDLIAEPFQLTSVIAISAEMFSYVVADAVKHLDAAHPKTGALIGISENIRKKLDDLLWYTSEVVDEIPHCDKDGGEKKAIEIMKARYQALMSGAR